MTLVPEDVRINVSASFPTQVIGANGIGVTKSSGIYTIANNYPSLAQIGAITDYSTKAFVVYDLTTGIYNSVTALTATSGSPTTVASLPAASANKGQRRFVTDSNASTFAAVVAGGGSTNIPVYSDGTNWRIG